MTPPASAARAAQAARLDRINRVNIGLMLASAAVAAVLPFEVFLASYAILGPLHYLTQISWLHDRGWFTTGRFDWIPLAGLGLLALDAVSTQWLSWHGTAFTALLLGVVAAWAHRTAPRIAALVAGVALSVPLLRWFPGQLVFVALLPTVIHVFVFTGLFILAGSMRSRSRTGYVSFAVFLACGAGLLLIQPGSDYRPHPSALARLGSFEALVDAMAAIAPGTASREAVSAIGRFLGFAYLYHYLNWFSKTGVIGWHEVSRRRMGLIVALWAASVGLYAWDYAVGLTALFYLSITHVFLEFPLDARTFIDVVTGMRRQRLGGAPAGGAPVRGAPVSGSRA